MAKVHIKTAWDSIRRSPYQALAAVFVLAITFFVSSILVVRVYFWNKLLNYFETRPQVIAFIKDDIEEERIMALKTKLEDDFRLKEIKYVTKEDALEIYKKATSDNPLLSELVSPDIFPASIEFSLINLDFTQEVVKEVEQEEIVDDVGFTANLGSGTELGAVVERLRTVTNYVRLEGLAFFIMLNVASFFVLTIIIGMRLTTRRQEVEILDLIGATPGFIRSPIIIEALIYAASGVFLGWLAALTTVLYATPSLVSGISYLGDIRLFSEGPVEIIKLFGVVLGGELVIAFVLTTLGGLFAVARARKKK